MKNIVFAAAAVAAFAAVPASAITAFATFSPQSNASNIDFVGTNSGAGTLTATAGAPVTFHFLDASGSTSVFDVSAILTLSAVTTSGTVVGGVGIVPVTSGTINFTALAPVTYNGFTGTNLLTATFTGGAVTGLIGGSVASLLNSQPPSAVTFTSSFIDFSSTTARDLSLAINAINPSILAAPGGVANFSGTVSGNFGADLTSGSGSNVPEPASWALMLGGFGLVGAMARRRAARVVAA